MPEYNTQIITNRIPILGLMAEQVTSFPASPPEGLVVHRTDLKQYHAFLNGAWVQMDNTVPAVHNHDDRYYTETETDTLLAAKAPTARTLTAGTGLTGGGDLTANRTFAVSYGTTAGTAMEGSKRLDTIGIASDLSIGGFKLVNVATPVQGSDGANKAYVDNLAVGIEWKQSVKVASTTNQALTGISDPITIDGVSVSLTGGPGGVPDRVLLKNQSNPVENGIYIKGGSAFLRATDADASGELSPNAAVFVERGTTQADTGWTIDSDTDVIVPGTTAHTWTQFTGVGALIAGAGLTKSGNTVDLVAADGSIIVNADSITVGNVPIAKGGTGATTANGALVNLGASKTVVVAVPALTAGTWTAIATGLNLSLGYQAEFKKATGNAWVILDYRTNGNSIEVRSDIAVGAGVLNMHVTATAI